MNWRVPLADVDIGNEEIAAIVEVLRGKWLSMGEVTSRFETRFAEAIGVKHALAVSNGTQALHLACLALGIGPGDEVIVPSLTFVASSNAVLYCQAQVRFADIIDPLEPNIDPGEIERLVTPRTKAVLLVHYGGYPCRMEEILSIARRKGIKVIEDCAHAPGAQYRGRALGSLGDIACFSFFANKNLATGEGGMVTTNEDELAAKVRLLRSHGMTSLTWERHQGHAFSYDVVALGYNFRIDEMRAAIGIKQLEKLPQNNLKREYITRSYWQDLHHLGVDLPFAHLAEQAQIKSAYHLLPILLPEGVERLALMRRLREEGIQTSIHYPPVHLFSYYQKQYPSVVLTKTEAYARREVTLPLFPGMSVEQQQAVTQAVKRALGSY